MNAYQLSNVVCGYGSKFNLSIDNLIVKRGDILGVVGANGSGKTTLLMLLAFLKSFRSGSIVFFGEPYRKERLFAFRKKVTLLLQEPLLLKRTVFENVAYGLKIRGDTLNLKKRVIDSLEMVGLNPSSFLTRTYNELSGGEIKRAALASRIIIEPEVLLLDEPTANIDAENAELINRALKNISCRHNTTMLISSNDDRWLKENNFRTVSLTDVTKASSFLA